MRSGTELPLTRDPAILFASSLVIAGLMAGASITGLLYPTTAYPTDELLQTFVPNDVVNLCIGVPILLGSIWLARKGKLIGLLFWPGALLFVFYNYLIYVLAMPLNMAFMLHLVLVTTTLYTLIGLIFSVAGELISRRLVGAVPARLAGGILFGLGLLILLQVVGILGGELIASSSVSDTELAVHIADFLIIPTWIIGGILLWRRQAFGYVIGLGLLFQASMLFIGLIVFLLLQPLLTDAPLAPLDIVVVSVMGLICFIPFALFLRGAGSHTSRRHYAEQIQD